MAITHEMFEIDDLFQANTIGNGFHNNDVRSNVYNKDLSSVGILYDDTDAEIIKASDNNIWAGYLESTTAQWTYTGI